MKDEIMKNFTITAYPSTQKLYMELKEKNEWTHDQAINKLVKFYKEKKENDNVQNNN